MKTGIGLRGSQHQEVTANPPRVGWFEAHTENYLAPGGFQREMLRWVRDRYPVSLHGVGMSIGSTDPLDREHLRQTAALVKEVQPFLVSEHLSWSSVEGRFTNDLLPLPYTEEALRHMIGRVRAVQEFLGRQILIENVSSYLRFSCSTLTEGEFLAALARESGCGILLDVNNAYVNAVNHAFDAHELISALPRESVLEIHLAGHTLKRVNGATILIDTHNAPVCDAVWDLYVHSAARFPGAPALIEWDCDLPPLEALAAEAHKADRLRERTHARAA